MHLTPTELALLREFVLNPGVLLTHAELLRRVWGRGYETQTEYTRVYVARLRSKLEDPDGAPLFITEPRPGYRFRSAPGAEAFAPTPPVCNLLTSLSATLMFHSCRSS